MVEARQATNKLIGMIEQGLLDKDVVIRACLNYLSEADVLDMAEREEFFTEDETED